MAAGAHAMWTMVYNQSAQVAHGQPPRGCLEKKMDVTMRLAVITAGIIVGAFSQGDKEFKAIGI